MRELGAVEAIEAFVGRYQSERADDVEDVDGDMLLFQWGTYGWGGPPSFQYEIARQFVVAGFGAEEADDAMWQLHLTLHYPVTDVTASLGAGNRWCTRLDGVSEFRAFIVRTTATDYAVETHPERVELWLDRSG